MKNWEYVRCQLTAEDICNFFAYKCPYQCALYKNRNCDTCNLGHIHRNCDEPNSRSVVEAFLDEEFKSIDTSTLPKIGTKYKHFKGGTATIIHIVKHSETGEELVIYECNGHGNRGAGIYARPASMFFSKVDKEKYPDTTQKHRFERIG